MKVSYMQFTTALVALAAADARSGLRTNDSRQLEGEVRDERSMHFNSLFSLDMYTARRSLLPLLFILCITGRLGL